MKRKILVGLGMVILVVGAWLIFDYYHYFPPGMPLQEVKQQAQTLLKEEAPNLIRNNMDPNMRKEIRAVNILDVRELKGRTYLVYKLDYAWVGPAEAMPYGFNSGGYMLGLRLVEQKLAGITLEKGMEFESSYMGAGPVECGINEEGVFYGFCKDPRVDKATLETRSGKRIPLQLNKRVLLAQLPEKNMEVYPRFYSANGSEIELNYGMKVAFLSKDEKTYQQYTNTPMEWWALKAKDCSYLRSNDVDALWVFPDQHKEALQGEVGAKLRELAMQGIPVIFIGLKESGTLASTFKVKGKPVLDMPVNDIEALYVARVKDSSLSLGAISLEDQEVFPVMEKSLLLRYQLQDYQLAGKSSGEEYGKNVKATAIPVPASPVQVRTGTAGGSAPVKGVTP